MMKSVLSRTILSKALYAERYGVSVQTQLAAPLMLCNAFATTAETKETKPKKTPAKKSTKAPADKKDAWIVAQVCKSTSLNQPVVEAVIKSFVDELKKGIMSGQTLPIQGFGTFRLKRVDARTARNPRTGAVVKVPKKKVFEFKRSDLLKVKDE